MSDDVKGKFAMHNESFSIYQVLTVLGETFVDASGRIHETKDYTLL